MSQITLLSLPSAANLSILSHGSEDIKLSATSSATSLGNLSRISDTMSFDQPIESPGQDAKPSTNVKGRSYMIVPKEKAKRESDSSAKPKRKRHKKKDPKQSVGGKSPAGQRKPPSKGPVGRTKKRGTATSLMAENTLEAPPRSSSLRQSHRFSLRMMPSVSPDRQSVQSVQSVSIASPGRSSTTRTSMPTRMSMSTRLSLWPRLSMSTRRRKSKRFDFLNKDPSTEVIRHSIVQLKPQSERELPPEKNKKSQADFEESEITSHHSGLSLALEEEIVHIGRDHFLRQIFGDMPSITNLSPPHSDEDLFSTTKTVPQQKTVHVSVAPASDAESSEGETETMSRESVGEEAEDAQSSSTQISVVVSEISLESFSDSDLYVPVKAAEESVIDFESCQRLTRVDLSDSSADDQSETNSADIKLFLNHIIDQIEAHCKKRAVYLRLDKLKLQKELKELIRHYQAEKKSNNTLQTVLTDHFLRRKMLSYITQPKNDESMSKSRLMAALVELDNRLELLQGIEKNRDRLVAELVAKEEEAQIVADQTLQSLEKKIKETLCKDGMSHVQAMVNYALREMSKFRNEISTMYQELTFIQHRFASILRLAEKLENIGDGLELHEYLSNTASNQALIIKIQEMDIELRHWTDIITNNTHTIAHLQNKNRLSKNLNARLKERLKEQLKMEQEISELLFKEIKKRTKIKRETQSIRKAGGLLQYPDLMRDFDGIIETIETKQKSVAKLREEHDRLERRIRVIQKRTLAAESSD
ncbi:hypothetical protein KR018_001632 [Drosophila ironensis]|nr:hypothetical protein KR018_001632 [Drosophila ironensis]